MLKNNKQDNPPDIKNIDRLLAQLSTSLTHLHTKLANTRVKLKVQLDETEHALASYAEDSLPKIKTK